MLLLLQDFQVTGIKRPFWQSATDLESPVFDVVISLAGLRFYDFEVLAALSESAGNDFGQLTVALSERRIVSLRAISPIIRAMSDRDPTQATLLI